MNLGLSADEVLASTRAVRKRLDFDRPVEPEVIKECLELAVQAPTGSNSQGWQWLVVTDPAKKAALAKLYQDGFASYAKGALEDIDRNADAASAQMGRVADSAIYLSDRMADVPVMLIPCMPGRLDGMDNMGASSTYGSIHPGTWSFMLAARERGLGTAWTTIHLFYEKQAAEILGIDYEKVTQTALITVGYSIGTDFKPAKRPPIETVTHWDSWGGTPPWVS